MGEKGNDTFDIGGVNCAGNRATMKLISNPKSRAQFRREEGRNDFREMGEGGGMEMVNGNGKSAVRVMPCTVYCRDRLWIITTYRTFSYERGRRSHSFCDYAIRANDWCVESILFLLFFFFFFSPANNYRLKETRVL